MLPSHNTYICMVMLVLSVGFFDASVLAQNAAPSPTPTQQRAWSQDERSPSPTTATHAWPSGILLAWRTLGIDAERTASARAALQQTWQQLGNTLLSDAQTASKLFDSPTSNLSMNRRRRLDSVQVGQVQAAYRQNTPIAVEPVWCSILDHDVFFVTLVDAKLNRLLGSAHFAQRRPATLQALHQQTPALIAQMGQRLPQLLQAAANAANQQNSTTSNLQLSLDLGRNQTRPDEGDSACLNMLLEQTLVQNHTVVRDLGTDLLTTLRVALGHPAQLARPNRSVLNVWDLASGSSTQPQTKRQLPQKFQLTSNYTETVFGQIIPQRLQSSVALQANTDGTITTTLDQNWTKFLDGEKASLLVEEWPQVVKVDRAWVYLDRGRAWGLRMRDRLVAQVGNELVKGHVVSYFGPELGLTSPRGFPIREGAILYIRKGQKLTKKGLEFRYDQKTYPTSWPPAPTTAAMNGNGL